jgi:hypothetical protein
MTPCIDMYNEQFIIAYLSLKMLRCRTEAFWRIRANFVYFNIQMYEC